MLDDRRPSPRRWQTVLLIFAAVFLFGVVIGALCEELVMYRVPSE